MSVLASTAGQPIQIQSRKPVRAKPVAYATAPSTHHRIMARVATACAWLTACSITPMSRVSAAHNSSAVRMSNCHAIGAGPPGPPNEAHRLPLHAAPRNDEGGGADERRGSPPGEQPRQVGVLVFPEPVDPRLEARAEGGVALVIAVQQLGRDGPLAYEHVDFRHAAGEQLEHRGPTAGVGNRDVDHG